MVEIMKTKKKIKKNKIALYILSIVTVIYMCVYLIWRAVYTIPSHSTYGWLAFVFGIALLIAEMVSALEAFAHCKDMLVSVQPPMPEIPKEMFPEVDVFIATHNEEEELLYKTINACTYMKYPDKSKVHIYVCDDGNREAVAKLSEKMGVGYFGLANNKLAKAGNLNNALGKTKSPLVVTFDADMIPSAEFLLETVPYFFLPKMKQDSNGNWTEKSEDEIDKNEKVGFIQLPQSFYNPDLFQYNLFMEGSVPNEQDYFFRQINVGRNNSNSPIYAGSNTVISREALEEVGGICTGTITEDFETGIMIEAKGYRCYAINKLLAKGLAPTTIMSLIKQRERWGRGCVHSLRRVHLFLNPNIPFKMKVSYASCRTYWDSFLRRFVYIASPIVFALTGIPVVICGLKELLLIWLPAYLLYAIMLRANSGNIRTSRISNIIDTIMFPYLIVPIFAEFLCIHKKEFYVTEKSKKKDENPGIILVLPHLTLFILSFIALVIMCRDALIYNALGSIIIIYWLLVNSSALIMAIFFMLGRKNMRNSERFVCNINAEILYKDKIYTGHTIDISEGGFSIEMNEAVYFPYEKSNSERIEVTLFEKQYKAKMLTDIVSVIKDKDSGWKYSFQIREIEELDKGEFMQLIYDRVHTLPKNISVTSSVYGDMFNNIKGRVSRTLQSSRRLPRVKVHKSYPVIEGGTVEINNFNFEYVYLSQSEIRKVINIVLGEDVVLSCSKEKDNLYKVNNKEALINSKKFNDILKEWEDNDK